LLPGADGGNLNGKQESRAVAREPRNAAAVFGLKFADNIH